jgi:hypothetical protein
MEGGVAAERGGMGKVSGRREVVQAGAAELTIERVAEENEQENGEGKSQLQAEGHSGRASRSASRVRCERVAYNEGFAKRYAGLAMLCYFCYF